MTRGDGKLVEMMGVEFDEQLVVMSYPLELGSIRVSMREIVDAGYVGVRKV